MSMKTDATNILRPNATGLGALLATLLIGALCVAFMVFGLVLWANGNAGIGLFMEGMAAFMGLMARYVWRDLRGKQAWLVTLGPEVLALHLPAGRSITRKLSAIHENVEIDEIAAIESRLEAYRSLGMVNMQRAYALKLKTGKVIILGEDRALGTSLKKEILAKTVRRIAAHAGLEIHDLGMAEGSAGILSIINNKPPPWDAPALDATRQAELWRQAKLTGWLALAAVALVVSAILLRRFL
ncbi:MAG: hypothetical protein ACE5G1_08335 [bacterium]